MTVGFIVLAHGALERAAEVVRHWAEAGAPVVIHIDARAPRAEVRRMTDALAGLDRVRFSRRRRCEWGTWSLTAATQDAGRLLLDAFPDASHVFLASGSCLPIRPLGALKAFLAAHQATDFIQSAAVTDAPWTIGGLDLERFTLRFPFPWKRRRRLFDGYVRLQRRLKVCRALPDGLVPHLGSQWWCLTRTTLAAILDDPRRPEFDRYFRRVWIPDEAYFQTLARRVSPRIESRSLTLARFDAGGRPHVLYDDHLEELNQSDHFVARKIWSGADRLYEAFLRPGTAPTAVRGRRLEELFTAAGERRQKGRPGLYMQSRFPRDGWENGKTAAPYGVYEGFEAIFEDFPGWIARMGAGTVHGRLFAPDAVQFAEGAELGPGNLSNSAALRDHDPRGFLANLVRTTGGERQAFLFGPGDAQAITHVLAADPNAHVAAVSGAWLLPLLHSGRPFAELRREAAWLNRVETEHLGHLQWTWARARVRVWTLAAVLSGPVTPLRTLVADLEPGLARGPIDLPRLLDVRGLAALVAALRNDGLEVRLAGAIVEDGARHEAQPRSGRTSRLP